MVDLHYMMSKHLYIMVDLHYKLVQHIMDFSHYIMHTIQHIINCEQDIMTMMNQMFYSIPSDSFGVPYILFIGFTCIT